jgi:hypothetical protein
MTLDEKARLISAYALWLVVGVLLTIAWDRVEGASMTSDKPSLLLKWGSIKGWDDMTPDQVAILRRWQNEGVSMSAMAHRDSDTQKAIVCELIDTMEDGQIHNDWEGASMTREEAKEYVMGYGRTPAAKQ